MPRQDFDLSWTAGSGWQGSLLIDPALVAGGEEAYLRHFSGGTLFLELQLSATPDGDAQAPGPELAPGVLGAAYALIFSATDSSIAVGGPTYSGNDVLSDSREPYVWRPPNIDALTAWLAEPEHAQFRLTLTDGPRFLRGAAEAGGAEATARAQAEPLVKDEQPPVSVAGAAEAGKPEAGARVDVPGPLVLADFDTDGLELDALALIEAGAGANDTLFGQPPRTAVGTLLDGELGIGSGDTQITRIRRRGGNILVVNDDEPLSLDAYFNGAGADLTLYVQTRDGVASVPVSMQSNAGANFIQLGALDAAFQALLDGIADGDRFIFALARQAVAVVAVRGAAAAGGAEAAARLLRVTPAVHALRGAALAGGAEARARLSVQRVRSILGAAQAGGAQALAHVLRARHLLIRGRARSGRPRATADVRLATLRTMRGEARAGGALVLAQVRIAATAALYERSLRETAPADRVLHRAGDIAPGHRSAGAGHQRYGRPADRGQRLHRAPLRREAGGRYRRPGAAGRARDRQYRPRAHAVDRGDRRRRRRHRARHARAQPSRSAGRVGAHARRGRMTVDQERVTARLGFDPLLGNAAVTLRHDPETSPGLF